MKKKVVIQIIILILLVASIGFYFYQNREKPEKPVSNEELLAEYLEFKVLDENIPPEALEKFQKKFEVAKEKLLIDPENFYAWIDLGMMKKTVNDYQGAEKAWLHLSEIRPQNSTSFWDLGDLYHNFLKDYPKAEWAYKQAIENSMGEFQNANYYRGLFELYYFQYKEKKDLAKPIIEEAIKNNPDNEDLKNLWKEYYE
ncbi:MAG: hypothetical protein Athens071412_676 [Parcubacteria group bacterium Athens0714_12]|nr:MAG: hypothetical protein Athens071412_676 [Parcubacteria group bacterium Athens0714_12]